MTYRISEEAEKDLENIWKYTYYNWSIEQTDHYLNLIFSKIETTTNNPYSGINYNKIIADYYCLRVKSHIVFYKINIQNNSIDIIRVLHKQMDVLNILKEENK